MDDKCEPCQNCDTGVYCEPKTLPSGLTVEQLLHLRSLVNKYERLQDARLAFENQIRAINDEVTPKGRLGFIMEETALEGIELPQLEDVTSRGKNKKVLGIKSYEDDMTKEMKPIVEQSRMWIEWLGMVKGIGLLTAAKIIVYFEPYWAELEVVLNRKKKTKTGELLDEEEIRTKKLFRPKSRSSLTKLCGYSVDDSGRATRRVRGQQNNWNPRFKSFFYVLTGNIMMVNDGKLNAVWKKYHEECKASYPQFLKKWYNAETREECKKINKRVYIPNHAELAKRRFIKTFISLIWEKYQEIYKLQIPPPQHCRDMPLTNSEWIHPNDICEPQVHC